MNCEQLIRALRKYARKRNIHFELVKDRGKGGHYLVAVGSKRTILQSTLSPGKVERALKQLEIDIGDV